MKSLETQLVEKEAELNKLRRIVQGFAETGTVKRNANGRRRICCRRSHQGATSTDRICPARGTQQC
jgi:hypothetical protein